jgi:hypothetical protein
LPNGSSNIVIEDRILLCPIWLLTM